MSMQIEQQDACRICLQGARSDQYEPINIFELELEQSGFSLVEALTVICGVNISREDVYPKLICLNCFSQLKDAFKLRLLAQRSQETLSCALSNVKSEPEYKSVDVLPDDVLSSKFFDESASVKSEAEDHSDLQRIRCCDCEESFENEQQLRRHSNHEHHPTKPIAASRRYRKSKQSENDTNSLTESPSVPVCCGCVTVFQSIPQLKEHQQREHSEESVPSASDSLPVQCSACHKRFPNQRLLNQHQQSSSKRKFFRCPECPATRRSIQEVLDHASTHTGARAFLCCGCPGGFCSKEELKRHSLAEHATRPKFYHDDDYEQKRPFLCDICYRRYRSKQDLVKHQQVVYDAKVHMCEVCGKGFHQARTLNLHMATHVEQADHPCPTCGKKYRHETLARHCMLRHKRPTELRCRICQAVFSDSSNLNSHLISHSDVRKHKCHLCEQTFKRPGHLRLHMESAHTLESNFSCRHCSKQFSTPSTLKRHEIAHTGKYPYRCEICSKPFKTRKYYVEHYEKHIEDSAKLYRCHLCEERYSRQYFLSNHLKFSHRIEPTEVGWNAKFKQGTVGDEEEQLDDEMEDGGEYEGQGACDKV